MIITWVIKCWAKLGQILLPRLWIYNLGYDLQPRVGNELLQVCHIFKSYDWRQSCYDLAQGGSGKTSLGRVLTPGIPNTTTKGNATKYLLCTGSHESTPWSSSLDHMTFNSIHLQSGISYKKIKSRSVSFNSRGFYHRAPWCTHQKTT